MGIYDFEVLKDGAVIAAEQTIALPDTSAAWPKIAELAKAFDEPGHKIRVKDDAGGIVILIGVSALRRCANAVSTGHLQVRVSQLHVKATMINDPEKRTHRGFEERRRARRRRAPSCSRSHDNGAPWERHSSPSNALGRCPRSLCADRCRPPTN